MLCTISFSDLSIYRSGDPRPSGRNSAPAVSIAAARLFRWTAYFKRSTPPSTNESTRRSLDYVLAISRRIGESVSHCPADVLFSGMTPAVIACWDDGDGAGDGDGDDGGAFGLGATPRGCNPMKSRTVPFLMAKVWPIWNAEEGIQYMKTP